MSYSETQYLNDIEAAGENAFLKEFTEQCLVPCPYVRGTKDAEHWKRGYNRMDLRVQDNMQPLFTQSVCALEAGCHTVH